MILVCTERLFKKITKPFICFWRVPTGLSTFWPLNRYTFLYLAFETIHLWIWSEILSKKGNNLSSQMYRITTYLYTDMYYKHLVFDILFPLPDIIQIFLCIQCLLIVCYLIGIGIVYFVIGSYILTMIHRQKSMPNDIDFFYVRQNPMPNA